MCIWDMANDGIRVSRHIYISAYVYRQLYLYRVIYTSVSPPHHPLTSVAVALPHVALRSPHRIIIDIRRPLRSPYPTASSMDIRRPVQSPCRKTQCGLPTASSIHIRRSLRSPATVVNDVADVVSRYIFLSGWKTAFRFEDR